jgi:ribosomal protein S27AE
VHEARIFKDIHVKKAQMTKPELIEAVDNLAAKVNKMFNQLKESEMITPEEKQEMYKCIAAVVIKCGKMNDYVGMTDDELESIVLPAMKAYSNLVRTDPHYECQNCGTSRKTSMQKRLVCGKCGESFELGDVK